MKTFRDKILGCENPKEVLKYFNVDGSKIELTAKDLKSIMLEDKLLPGTKDYEHNLYMRRKGQPTLKTTIKKLNDDILAIQVTAQCECGGSWEVNCPDCDGIGEHYCDICDDYHECAKCRGTGGIECEICEKNQFEEDEILYEDTIILNQGELF